MELESRIAFQEQSIQTLSHSLHRQQQIIDRMEMTIEELRQRLRAVSASPLSGDVPEPPPPHY